MRNFWLAASIVALSACGNSTTGVDGGEGVAAVRPSQVTAAELRAASTEPRLVRFYEARNWQPAWDAATAPALVGSLRGANRHGLDPQTFLGPVAAAEAPAAREAALTLAALTYAETLARGRVDPKRLRESYEVPRPNPQLAAGLNGAIAQGNVGEWLNGLAPSDDEYRALSQAYVAATQASARERPTLIPAGATIRPGGADPRLPAIAAALRAQSYLPPPAADQPAPAPAQRYTPEMVAAVRSLQEDNGLDPTGTIDAATLTAIDQGAFERARILAINLERRRWLPREAPPTRIDVNIAGAFLAYVRDGRVVDRRPVVAGQPDSETPEMVSPIFRLVAHPTWTVPESIEQEEILPKGPAYLERNNMVRRDGHIVQESGPTNSLGQVKFDMRNDQAIYLHDTPAKSLFAEDERHRSHGCVRVQDALGFAQMIAEQEGVLDDWREALAKNEETFVALPREIPVRLLYHTAFVDGGRIRFRPDVYGLDGDVARALGLPARPRGSRPSHVSDVGP
ncbi:MAG: L,D-transpeptidase family protein [Allosphingosinicella sp.]